MKSLGNRIFKHQHPELHRSTTKAREAPLNGRLQSILGKFGRGITEFTGGIDRCRRGRDNLDHLLEEYLPDKGTFIEAGALDGFNFSNTYFLDRVKGWHGLLVEPNPPQFTECVKFRKRAKVVQCALVPFNYPSPTVKIKYGADLTWTEGAYVGDEERQRRSLLKRYGLSGETIYPGKQSKSPREQFNR